MSELGCLKGGCCKVASEGASLFQPKCGGIIGKLGIFVLYMWLLGAETTSVVVCYLYRWRFC